MNGFSSLVETASDWTGWATGTVIDAGICAGLVATVVLAINVLFRRWLSSRQMGLLWGLVLVRLLVPAVPSSPVSLQNVWSSEPLATVLRIADDHNRGVDQSGTAYSVPPPAADASPDALPLSAPSNERPAIDLWSVVVLVVKILPLVWLIGAATSLAGTIILHWRFCRRLKRVPTCDEERPRRLWIESCGQAGVRQKIPILLFDEIGQPAVAGLFRPKLLLPPAVMELSDDQLRMVMLHELAHVRRWHIAANWILAVIRAVHWWNPVYWLAASRYQNLREQSCDAFAIRRIDGQPIRDYSELLLTLAERAPSTRRWRIMLPASILGFWPSFWRKQAFANRIQALRTAGITRGRWHTVAVGILFGLVVACGLTDASSPDSTPSRSTDWLPIASSAATWGVSQAINPGPSATRTYSVAKAVARIAADARSNDLARAELLSFVKLVVESHPQEGPKAKVDVDRAGFQGIVFEMDDEEQNAAKPDAHAMSQDAVTLDGTTLTVNASLNAHAHVERMLRAWEQGGLTQICVESRFSSANRDIAATIGVSWRYLEAFSTGRDDDLPSESKTGLPVVRATAFVDDYLPVALAVLDERQTHKFIETVQADVDSNVIQTPKVTFMNGQQASFENCTRRPFVVGIQRTVAGREEPKIAIVEEGLKLILSAVRKSAAKRVQLQGRVESSQINDVRTASATLRGKPASIQIPRVKRCRIDVSSEVNEGQSLLIGIIPTYEQKNFLYVLVTAAGIIEPSELERAASTPARPKEHGHPHSH